MSEVPYFDLFRGDEVSMRAIRQVNPMLEHSVQTMINTGHAIGQGVFDEEMETDVMVRLPNRGVIFESKGGEK